MDKVIYRTSNPDPNGLEGEDTKNVAYMVEQRQCRLCLQYFKQEEELMKIPLCEHIFHISCLKKWLMDFQKCPVCESNIIRLPEGKQASSIDAHALGHIQQANNDGSGDSNNDAGEIEFKKIEPDNSTSQP